MDLNYEIIGKLTELGYIEHKIFISCKPQIPHQIISKKVEEDEEDEEEEIEPK